MDVQLNEESASNNSRCGEEHRGLELSKESESSEQVHTTPNEYIVEVEESEYYTFIKRPDISKYINDDIERFRNEFVKRSYDTHPEASNRLFYIGSHYPRGYKESEIKDPAWDFTQEVLDFTSIVDKPIVLNHNPAVEIGKVLWQIKDEDTGVQYHYGYIDDNSEEGKEAIRGVESKELSGLSVHNGTLFVGESITDPKMKTVLVPYNISIVKKGHKKGTDIHAFKKVDLKKLREKRR